MARQESRRAAELKTLRAELVKQLDCARRSGSLSDTGARRRQLAAKLVRAGLRVVGEACTRWDATARNSLLPTSTISSARLSQSSALAARLRSSSACRSDQSRMSVS